MSRGFWHEDASRVATLLAPRRSAAISRVLRGYRRFAPQPPTTVCHAFGVGAHGVDASCVGRSCVGASANPKHCPLFPAMNSNPKDCQKVAGGRSEAKTSGTEERCESIPQGCQNGLP